MHKEQVNYSYFRALSFKLRFQEPLIIVILLAGHTLYVGSMCAYVFLVIRVRPFVCKNYWIIQLAKP